MTEIKPGRFYVLRQQTEEESFWTFVLSNIELDTISVLEYKADKNKWIEILRSKSRMNLIAEIEKISILPFHSMELKHKKKVIKSVLERKN